MKRWRVGLAESIIENQEQNKVTEESLWVGAGATGGIRVEIDKKCWYLRDLFEEINSVRKMIRSVKNKFLPNAPLSSHLQKVRI